MSVRRSAFKNSFVVISVMLLSGCIGPFAGGRANVDSGENLGGVVRSDDAGITLVEKNIINEASSLAVAAVTHIEIDPVNPDVVYAGSIAHGMLKSEDRGESWVPLPFISQFIDDIVIDPANTQTLYVSTVWENRGRVYRSFDAGQTWEEIYIEPVSGTRVTTMALDYNDTQRIFIGTTTNASGVSTIAYSENGGLTWRDLAKNSVSIKEIHIDRLEPNNMYVTASDRKLYRSQDNGVTWNPLTYERGEEGGGFQGEPILLFLDPKKSGRIYLGTSYSLYQTDTYGDRWEELDIISSARGIPISAISLSSESQLVFASEKAIYASQLDGSWVITDIESRRRVSKIVHDPFKRDILYIGYRYIEQ